MYISTSYYTLLFLSSSSLNRPYSRYSQKGNYYRLFLPSTSTRKSSHTARSGLSNRSATLTVFRPRTSIIDVPRLRLPLHAASPLNATDHQPCCPLLPCADPCALHTDITSSKSPSPKGPAVPPGGMQTSVEHG